jgi:NADPH-dependent curcumin reductase CurA
MQDRAVSVVGCRCSSTTIQTKRLLFRGIIVSDFASQLPQFLADMVPWLKASRIKYKKDITDGLENAPRELIGLL